MPKRKNRTKSQMMVRGAIHWAREGACQRAARLFDKALDVRNGGLDATRRRESATIIVGNCKRKAPAVAKKIAHYAK
jgi:hypothetical protein